MNRYIIGSLWDRANRNGVNKNFEYLFEGSKRVDALNSRADNILSKSNTTLNEAQQTNDMNENVQHQIDTLIAESGTSDAEVLQARIDSEGNEYDVLKTRLDEKEQNFSAQLAQIPNQNALKFIHMLNNGVITKIKLVGDSVTAGAQAEGYVQPDDSRIILTDSRFNHGGTGYARETGSDWSVFPSWGNLFRKFINTYHPSIDFFNAGIGGLTADEVAKRYLSQIIEDDEDVLFIMLGINDSKSYSLEAYETNMRTIIDYAKERSNLIVLTSPPPTTSEFHNDNPTDGLKQPFGSKEIDGLLRDLAEEYGFPFVSHYIASSEFLSRARLPYYGVEGINSDHTHPNTLGYLVMWQNLQAELRITNGDVTEWGSDGKKDLYITDYGNEVSAETPLTDFDLRSFHVHQIFGANRDGFPEEGGASKSGVLLTYIPARESLSLWGYQHFIVQGTGQIYFRAWEGSSWSSWDTFKSGSSSADLLYKGFSSYDSTTNPLDYYTENSTTHSPIQASNPDIANFPEGKRGLLTTMRPSSDFDVYARQEYRVHLSNSVYARYWNGSAWTSWEKISAV